MITNIINWSIIGFLILLNIRLDWRQSKNLRDEKELLFRAIDKDRDDAEGALSSAKDECDRIYMKKEVFQEIEKRYFNEFNSINIQLKEIKELLDEIRKG